MVTKSGQKRAGLSAANGRQGTRVEAVQLTPAPRTRHYKLRARKCAHKACGALFTPAARHGKYCSDACRKADARRRQKRAAKVGKTVKVQRDLVEATCLWCHNTFLPEQGRGAKYCSDSHRELAYRQRREAAIEALVGDLGGMSAAESAAFVERLGMRLISRYLRQQGYVYSEPDRQWLMALPVGNVFVGVEG